MDSYWSPLPRNVMKLKKLRQLRLHEMSELQILNLIDALASQWKKWEHNVKIDQKSKPSRISCNDLVNELRSRWM